MYYAVLLRSGVNSFLARSLVRTNADLFVLLGSRIVKSETGSNVPAYRLAILKERYALRRCGIEPVIRLTKHHGHRKLRAGLAGNRKLVGVARYDWTRTAGSNRSLEDAVLHCTVACL